MKRRLFTPLIALAMVISVLGVVPATVSANPSWPSNGQGDRVHVWCNDNIADAVRISLFPDSTGNYTKFCWNVQANENVELGLSFCSVPLPTGQLLIPELCQYGGEVCACLNDTVTKYTVNYIRTGYQILIKEHTNGTGWSLSHNWGLPTPFTRVFVGQLATYNDEMSYIKFYQ